MEIGKRIKTIVIAPLELPIPQKRPAEAPPKVPDKERVPA